MKMTCKSNKKFVLPDKNREAVERKQKVHSHEDTLPIRNLFIRTIGKFSTMSTFFKYTLCKLLCSHTF